jgi:hypothetical protein
VVYARDEGTSYWSAGDGFYEEWLHVRKGRATAGAVVAAWTIEGAVVQETQGVVELLDAAGVPRVRMTAPAAFAADGRAVEAKLGVRGARVELSVDAGGDEVLVDPVWTSTGSMWGPRANHTATRLGSGKVLVTGGSIGANPPVGSAEIYDPSTNTWAPVASMSVARTLHAAALLPNGKVLVVGGSTGQGPLGSAEIYDPSTNTWTVASHMLAGRAGLTATLLQNGSVLAVGGLPTARSTPLRRTPGR